jgi:hypothetical protein
VSTPGTPEWLREQADRFLKDATVSNDLAEGLKRAANRIERLQGQMSKVKTGVDQTARPTRVTPTDTVISVYLPESDTLYTEVFEWVVDSGNYLDPAVITVDGPVQVPRVNNTKRRRLVGIEKQGRHFDRVRIQSHEDDEDYIDLADCRANTMGDDGEGEDRIRLSGRRM